MRLKPEFGAHQASNTCHPSSKAKEIRLLAKFRITTMNNYETITLMAILDTNVWIVK
jgi:hypothetical protein